MASESASARSQSGSRIKWIGIVITVRYGAQAGLRRITLDLGLPPAAALPARGVDDDHLPTSYQTNVLKAELTTRSMRPSRNRCNVAAAIPTWVNPLRVARPF